MPKKPASEKQIESFVHDDASRRNIPPAEFQTMVRNQEKTPIQVAYERRNPDLDPQLIWRGKDLLDESPLVVNAPPLYIQEKIHPKVLIDDLKLRSKEGSSSQSGFVEQIGLFDTIKGDAGEGAKTEFYQHDQNWSNRMILGDSLQVMASLAEREELLGKVQCIYFDPPYGIKFNSNFQWSTSSRDVKDGRLDNITREPEQVKAFRDTWRDGVHSYLGYLRDRLVAACLLLADSGSLFVQIGDGNSHRVRLLLDEVFGEENCIAAIAFQKTSGSTREFMGNSFDYLLVYAKKRDSLKFRPLFKMKERGGAGASGYTYVRDKKGCIRQAQDGDGPQIDAGSLRVLARDNLTSQSVGRDKGEGAASWFPVTIGGKIYRPSEKGRWKTNQDGMNHLLRADRITPAGNTLRYVRYIDDFAAFPIGDYWADTTVAGFSSDKNYIVETSSKVVERCLLAASRGVV